jgi:hypothetical protein
MKGKKGGMYGGMDKLPQETLREIAKYQKPTRTRQEYTPRRLAVEAGIPEEKERSLIPNLKAEFSRNYGHPMNAKGIRKYKAFLESQRESELAIARKSRVDQGMLIRLFLLRNPDGFNPDACVASGKKGGMPRKDKDIILPPPAVARVVIGEPTRPFEGQEVYADYPEAPSVFSDFTLAEEQRQLQRAEQQNSNNIASLYRQFGQLYPGGLAAEGSITAYNDFTERYLPSRTMNESYVANLPVAERRRIISAFLRQRNGMCVASGKGGGLLDALYKREKKGKAVIDYPKLSGFKAESKKMLRLANLPAMTREERQERAEALSTTPERTRMLRGRLGSGKKTSKWIEHVKAHAKTHGVSYKQAMKDSKHTYK